MKFHLEIPALPLDKGEQARYNSPTNGEERDHPPQTLRQRDRTAG